MKARALRAIAECHHIATMTEEPGRITRRFLTAPVHQVHAHLRARMEEMGMTVTVDATGNLRGLWEPQDAGARRLILGSHIDTVPDAGAFDGVLGITLALEWTKLAQELALPLPIEVIAFSEEEGMRFGVPFLGSRAVAGRFDPALLALTDADGTTLETAIRDFGLNPAEIGEAAAKDNALAFIEIHIEQGPALEAEGLCVAAVTGIVGQTRLSVEFKGHANHAGTTPMHLRSDALAGAAEWITAVESLALKTDGLVATVGKAAVKPNAGNVIPGNVELSLDVRHPQDVARRAAVDELLTQAQAISHRRGICFEWHKKMDEPAVRMDERITAYLAESLEVAGFQAKTMPSGAGHDAMVMAGRIPSGMLFVRSPGGISHNPAEAVREEDVEAALHVGREFLKRLAAEIR
jgi:allantoate deiminase